MEQLQIPHDLTLKERQSLHLTGVNQVLSFDEAAVVLDTSLGQLMIQGKGLQLKTLSLEGGQVAVDGHITALIYAEPRPKGGFWGRLFR